MKKAITYYRVSTERQGGSGLGLDAQKASVLQFAANNHFALAGEFVEIESGKKNTRPVLHQALNICKQEGATLLIAKLDRLGRNVAFISRLMEAGVDFKAVDNPFAGKLIVHIMAAFAEHERDQISERTTAALAAAKLRGVVLGSYGRTVLAKLNKQKARQFALKMKPIIQKLRGMGITTIRGLTCELNRLQVPTFRNSGNRWHLSTVHNILRQIVPATPLNNHPLHNKNQHQ